MWSEYLLASRLGWSWDQIEDTPADVAMWFVGFIATEEAVKNNRRGEPHE